MTGGGKSLKHRSNSIEGPSRFHYFAVQFAFWWLRNRDWNSYTNNVHNFYVRNNHGILRNYYMGLVLCDNELWVIQIHYLRFQKAILDVFNGTLSRSVGNLIPQASDDVWSICRILWGEANEPLKKWFWREKHFVTVMVRRNSRNRWWVVTEFIASKRWTDYSR